MIDLRTWRKKLQELRELNAEPLHIGQRNDLIDGVRQRLWPLCGGLFVYPNFEFHDRTKMSRDERLAWLKTGKRIVDFVRVCITAYLTDGQVSSWKDNDQPEVYYLVSETIAGLSPAETILLIKAAFQNRQKYHLNRARYGDLLDNLTYRT